ncbi:hypothetical protein SUGI_0650500 [Cryptomeria japonica]|nr:hypothetical protein SUGI_0650500 [Cryptomeria japonica]
MLNALACGVEPLLYESIEKLIHGLQMHGHLPGHALRVKEPKKRKKVDQIGYFPYIIFELHRSWIMRIEDACAEDHVV